jgi:hypothetical protein
MSCDVCVLMRAQGFYVFLGAGVGLIVVLPIVLVAARFRIHRPVGLVLVVMYAAFLLVVFLTGFPWYHPIIPSTTL